MADSSNDTTIRIKTEPDNSGAKSAEKALDNVGGAAERAGAKVKSSFEKAENSAKRFQRTVGMLRNVLTGFGVVGLVNGLVSMFGRLRDSLGEAKEKADELAKAREKAEHAEAVEALAKSYERLSESMRKASDEMRQENELEDLATKNARALEDAQNEHAKQNELSAIDEDDPLADEKRARVEAKYAAIRNQVESRRRHEDVERDIGRRRAESSEKSKEAEAIEDSLLEDDSMIADVRQRLDNATRRSNALNAKDNTDFPAQIGSDLKNIVTLNWGRVSEVRTEEGDKMREEARAEAEQLKQELKRLEEQRRTKQEKADSLRSEAANLGMKADAAETGRETALELELAGGLESQRREDQAKRALEKRERRMEEDRQTVTDGGRRKGLLESTAETERARAQAAADAYEKESADVVSAQNRYDMLVANGGSRKERSAALAALQKEQREAEEAKHEMEVVAAQVANTLQGINAQIKTLSNAVKSAQGRLSQNQTDAPEG